MMPKAGFWLLGLLIATKRSPLGVTAMCRAAMPCDPDLRSATTIAQKPAGSVSPALLASHCRRVSATVVAVMSLLLHAASKPSSGIAIGANRIEHIVFTGSE